MPAIARRRNFLARMARSYLKPRNTTLQLALVVVEC